jgi:hypothetical protein
VLGLTAPQAKASRIVEVDATAFTVLFLTLPANNWLTLQSANCSSGADPFFHLMNVSSSGVVGTQLASDDNSGGGVNASITVSAITRSRQLALFARATSNTTGGTCTIRRNNVDWLPAAPVGGRFLTSASVTRLSGEHLRTQLLPGGSTLTGLIGFAPNDSTLAYAALGNGIAGASFQVTTANEVRFLVGTPRVAVEQTWQSAPRAGATRLLSNDARVAGDDDDGLGPLLEQALETCPNPTCIDAHHGRDTDRDGLTDFEEVFGVKGTRTDGRDDIALSRWGATPRQKDAFIEVDYVSDYGALRNMAVPAGANPFDHLENGVSVEDWVDEVLGVYVPRTSQNHLKNPAGRPINGQAAPPEARSLRIHLDIGVAPQTPTDEAKFGDYGGASHRVLDREARFTVSGPLAMVCLRINPQLNCGNATGLSQEAAATFIGLLAEGTGQPVVASPVFQVPGTTSWAVDIRTSTRGLPFTAELLLGVGGVGNASLERERLGRIREHYENDPAQVDPVRVGKFRYAVVDNDGQADGSRFVSWLQPPRTFAHELGHTFGMAHWGRTEWGADGIECIPHYLGLMRYGDDIYMRLNELDDVAFNPAQASEINPFGPFPTDIAPGNYTFLPSFPWQYPTPPGSNAATTADLNRDGAIDTANTWRTMALTLNTECISMSQGRQILESSQDVQGGLDLMRYGGRLYAFWVQGGQVRYRSALLGAVGNKSCTGPSTPYWGSCLSWSASKSLSLATQATGVTVQAFGSQIFVAYGDANSNLVIRRYTHSGTDTWNHQAAWTYGANSNERTNHTPELYIAHNQGPGTLSVAYLAQSGRFRQRSWDTNTSDWSAVQSAVGPAHRDNLTPVALLGSQPPVMKTWPDPTLAGFAEPADNEKRTYAVMPSGNGQMRLYVLTAVPATWGLVADLLQTPPGQVPPVPLLTGAKPFLEFRYLRNGNGFLRTHNGNPTMGGHLLIGFHEPADTATTARFWVSRYIDLTNPLMVVTAPGVVPPVDLLVRDFVHNFWAWDIQGTSLALYSDRSIDNVFGVLARRDVGVVFLPHADGSPNHDYRVWSDFRTLEDNVCWRLRNFPYGDYNANLMCGPVLVLD